VSGLLSYIGYIYILRYFKDEFKKIMSMDKNSIKRMNYEWETFGIDHAEISYIILESAGIIPELCIPVRNHHQKSLQESLGRDNIKNISSCLYLGSQLTSLFYEDLSSIPEFRKDIKSLTGLYSTELEDIVDEIIEFFRTESRSLGILRPSFPGYFKILSYYDTKLAMVQSELEIANKKFADINSQNFRYQKAIEDNNKKLVGLALQDPLTGAYNRRYLDEKLHDEFLKARRYNQSFTLISADIDHFKKINDTYGHAFGDLVLIKLVQIIKSTIRKTDYIARTGGEEFLVVCHLSNELGGIIIAEKMRKTIESSSFRFEGKDVPVTMSFGVVNYYPEVKSVEELIRVSDDRLYAAKNAGRNKVIYK
jgi:two-component system, cell cycle response regulator